MTPARLEVVADASTATLVGDEQLQKGGNFHRLAFAPRAERRRSCACASFAEETPAGEEAKLACPAETAVGLEVRGGDDVDLLIVFWFRHLRDTCEPSYAPRRIQSCA